eukprot:6969790-Alexandrium_andersonii.AAC.1
MTLPLPRRAPARRRRRSLNYAPQRTVVFASASEAALAEAETAAPSHWRGCRPNGDPRARRAPCRVSLAPSGGGAARSARGSRRAQGSPSARGRSA